MTFSELRPWNRCRRRPLMFLIFLTILPFAVSAPHSIPNDHLIASQIPVLVSQTDDNQSSGGRPSPTESVQAAPACVSPAINEFPDDFMSQEQRAQGGVVVHIIIVSYLCIFLGQVCDKYFVPSLELICEILKVPSDIAGATFMAIGTSAPELFSSVIGSFITEGDIGVGAIVGSAVFNVIGITGIAGLAVWKMEVPIDWYPVSRDCFAYTLSVLVLMFVLQDNTVVWYEAVIMIIMFVMYVLMMCFNGRIQKRCTNMFENVKEKWESRFPKKEESLTEKSPLLASSQAAFIDSLTPKKKVRFSDDPEGLKALLDSNGNIKLEVENKKELETPSIWKWPKSGFWSKFFWLIMWPTAFLLHLTVPDCRKPEWKKYYLVTFCMAVAWIAACTYLSVWMVTIIGFTFGIPDAISGITLLAVGTSVPEIISSIIVVRNGYGNMAICNLLGSNVFNIVFCLGAPWLIKTLMSTDGTIQINSAALTYMTLTLLSTVVVLYAAFILTKWRICWKIGIICIIMYIGFIGLACYFELDLMAGVSLPTCLTF